VLLEAGVEQLEHGCMERGPLNAGVYIVSRCVRQYLGMSSPIPGLNFGASLIIHLVRKLHSFPLLSKIMTRESKLR